MISKEIYEYLVHSSESKNIYAELQGLVFDKGILVQILSDGMVLFHNLKEKLLNRVLINHYDAINDLVIKEYAEEKITFFTCGKDNTLRIWSCQ